MLLERKYVILLHLLQHLLLEKIDCFKLNFATFAKVQAL